MNDEEGTSHKQKKRKKVKKSRKTSLHDTQSLDIEQNSSEIQYEGETNDTDQDDEVQVPVEPKNKPSPHNIPKQKSRPRHKASGKKGVGRSMYPHTVITAVLEELGDDMVEEPPRMDGGDSAITETTLQTPASLQPDKVYVERKNGFATTPRAKMFNSLNSVEEGLSNGAYSKSLATPLELAIFIQKCCRPVYVLCHGLLGGIALSHLILVYGTGDYFYQEKNFVGMYTTYARVFQSIFHILSILCFISIMDRCDIKHMDVSQVVGLFRFQFTTCLILTVYFITLILAFVTTKWDDWLALASYDSTEYAWGSNKLTVWRNLNLCRDIGAISGWILIALFPAEDMLHLHLCQMMKYQPITAHAPSRY